MKSRPNGIFCVLLSAGLILPACGSTHKGTTRPTVTTRTFPPSIGCPSGDNIRIVAPNVILAPGGTLAGCHSLPAATEVDATQTGQAVLSFTHSARCSFRQLTNLPKTARLIARNPSNTLFTMWDAQAYCALAPSAPGIRLCQKATLLDSGSTGPGQTVPPLRSQVLESGVSCNSDPALVVAVKAGTARIFLDTVGGPETFDVTAGRQLTIDLTTNVAGPPAEANIAPSDAAFLASAARAVGSG